MYYAYILFSDSRDRYYYGHCKDLKKRLKRHNSGINPFTKVGIPWELKYDETFATKSEAVKREMEFKGWKSRIMTEKLIKQSGCRPD
ncbi:MAG: GIY-YIG nuclease family protein [Candidatus Marinimicrobia bacterium]|jgi:putative endonuclease|nr:GIY-YIG nuclease family protein [Candidatus Neomarinimicrobiota bacterium]MBT3618322.1 GIY-YIG nuclease family protein [Candidatus Neomarinimicrobiota bacterium]MBT3828267.1 GIY-YIG nuclease family protein [Candidatus Neomarinimicrobiota bacterium]MBT3997184.1 GIY-YIG nuclease family protein [Candidatus Neomarinimicrobiota bacterium]MBT4280650.1 GIY-YIG nuclease family protein [Candidatus Neomarinimicrobiota bacterium]